MSDIKVSIIVPVYNTEEYLEKCVEAICSQTLKDIEILLIDDGSKEKCALLCDELANRDSRVVVIHQSNQGVCKARNRGIKEAQGEFIGFVDSDDFLEKDMFEVLYKNAMENGADISCVSNKVIMWDGRIKEKPESEEIHCWNKKEEFVDLFLKQQFISMGVYTKIFKREKYHNLYFNENFKINEDKLFVFQALLEADVVAFQSRNMYHYFRRENSSSIGSFSEKYFDIAKIGRMIVGETKKKVPALESQARACEISANMRMLKLLVQRSGLKQFKIEFKRYAQTLKKENTIGFCKKNLKKNDFFRWCILKSSNTLFIMFTQIVDHD